MFRQLKALFGGGGAQRPKARQLNHPRDLRQGDIIKFRFLDQPEISGNTFEVAQVNTYLYGSICYPELVLKDRTNQLIYLMVEEEDGDEYLALSRKVPKAQVPSILSPEQLTLFKEGSIGQALTPTQHSDTYAQWLAKQYNKADHQIKGAFIKGDARFLSDAEIEQREHFISFTAEDSDEEHALELEIYESGEQELSLSLFHELNAIEEMWPTEGEASA